MQAVRLFGFQADMNAGCGVGAEGGAVGDEGADLSTATPNRHEATLYVSGPYGALWHSRL